MALILRLEILAAKGGLASHGLEASKDCLSSPSPSPQRKQGGGSRGEEFGPVRASPSGPGSCLQLAPETGGFFPSHVIRRHNWWAALQDLEEDMTVSENILAEQLLSND